MAGCPAAPGALGPGLQRIPAPAAAHFSFQMTVSRQFSDHRCKLPQQVPGRTEPNITPSPARDPAADCGAQAGRFRRACRQRPVRALLRLKPIVICFTRAEEHELARRDGESPARSPGVTSDILSLAQAITERRLRAYLSAAEDALAYTPDFQIWAPRSPPRLGTGYCGRCRRWWLACCLRNAPCLGPCCQHRGRPGSCYVSSRASASRTAVAEVWMSRRWYVVSAVRRYSAACSRFPLA